MDVFSINIKGVGSGTNFLWDRNSINVVLLVFKDSRLAWNQSFISGSSVFISLRPLRSLDRHDLYVPRARTSMAQTRAFAIIGPSLWNQLLPSTRSTLLTGVP